MLKYTIRRLLLLIPTLFFVALIVFSLAHAAPGSPFDAKSNENKPLPQATIERLNHLYGIDKPVWEQFALYLSNAIRFDFGSSFVRDRPVIEIIGQGYEVHDRPNGTMAAPIAAWRRDEDSISSSGDVDSLLAREPQIEFTISIVARQGCRELERCVAAGAVLLKWLPPVQNINPADERCLPFYDALAHHRLDHARAEVDRGTRATATVAGPSVTIAYDIAPVVSLNAVAARSAGPPC